MKQLLLAAFMALGVSASAHASMENENLVLCGASPGGMWSNIGVGVDAALKGEYSGASATYQTSSGGPANVVQVKRGMCDVGLANDGDLAAALQGAEPFKEEVEGLQALGVMLDWLPVMWLARKDFAEEYGIENLTDLVEKQPPVRVVMNRRGLLTSDITTSLLGSMGVTADEIKSWGGSIQYQPSGEQAGLMQDGRVDLMANTLFEGDRGVAETANNVEMILLDVPAEANQAVIDEYFLKPWVIEAGAFPWHERDVNTVSTSVILFADENMSEEQAYAISKALINNSDKVSGVSKSMDRFSPEVLVEQEVVPWHPGAKRAFEEAGLL